MRQRKVYAIDFDGTLFEDAFPGIGRPKRRVIEWVKARQKEGHKTILYTCRTGKDLENAVSACRGVGLVFDTVNENLPEHIAEYGGDTRKICADYYIDDRNMLVEETENAGQAVNCVLRRGMSAMCARVAAKEGKTDR